MTPETQKLIAELRARAELFARATAIKAEDTCEWRAAAMLEAQEGENERLIAAIRWALGEEGEFEPRGENDPPYWWRTELRKRAGLIVHRHDPLTRTLTGEPTNE